MSIPHACVRFCSLALAVALASALFSQPVFASRPDGIGQTPAGSTATQPAATASSEDDNADIQPQAEGGPGWWQRFRITMSAKTYGLDEATTQSLMTILREEGTAKKQLEDENKSIVNSLDGTDGVKPTDDQVLEIVKKIQANRTAIAGVENRQTDRIVALLGPQRAAQYLLSQRGMLDRVRGQVHRGAEAARERDQQQDSSGEVRGNPNRNR